jgi:hypothetical protein
MHAAGAQAGAAGREMIDLLVVEESKPKPAKTGGVVRDSDRPVVQTHAVV